MSEQPIDSNDAEKDARDAGATDEGFGNLSVEDDPDGTTDPADLAGTGGSEGGGTDGAR